MLGIGDTLKVLPDSFNLEVKWSVSREVKQLAFGHMASYWQNS